jgi:hypothetical protein
MITNNAADAATMELPANRTGSGTPHHPGHREAAPYVGHQRLGGQLKLVPPSHPGRRDHCMTSARQDVAPQRQYARRSAIALI